MDSSEASSLAVRVFRRLALCVAVAPILAMPGCGKPLMRQHSPLAPAVMSPDSVALEVFFLRCEDDSLDAGQSLWQEIDEQHFSAELRQRLAENGFRVGLVAGPLPSPLARLMELEGKPTPTNGLSQTGLSDLQTKPRVVRRDMQLRAGRPGEITASSLIPLLPVLECRRGEISGQSYHDAQAVLAVRSWPEPDGRVRVDLVPEIQYGQPRRQWVAGQGMLVLETGRPKRTFDDLAIQARLSPGGMLVLTCLADRPGSLGHHFFTEAGDSACRKILVIRLGQTQHEGAFCPPEVLSLEPATPDARDSVVR